MQLFVLALVLAIFVHDLPGFSPALIVLPWWERLALWLLPKLLLAALYAVACAFARSRLGQRGSSRILRALDRAGGIYRVGVVVLYIMDLRGGALVWLRAHVFGRQIVLLDELLLLLPTLLMLLAGWWAYYPIDRRLREAALIGRLDQGLPIHPVWTRRQYLVAQFRHQVAMMLVPLLLMVGWYELVAWWYGDGLTMGTALPAGAMPALLTMLGAGCVFLLAPVMIRRIWDTLPLPGGELRDRLVLLCQRYRVGFRELLLWRTFGGMVNAAVMGLFAPVRYLLLTDALLEQLPAEQVEAVMAHEIAHVRKHHLFWLVVVAGSSLLALELTIGWGAYQLAAALTDQYAASRWGVSLASPLVRDGAMMAVVALFWVIVFGWVSRRFERQADTFAVAHLAQRHAVNAQTVDSAAVPRIDHAAVEVMVAALQQVAVLNHITPRRRSWRHGSIASRQAYLRTLVGQRVDALAIDRTVHWINFLGIVLIAAIIVLWPWLEQAPLLL